MFKGSLFRLSTLVNMNTRGKEPTALDVTPLFRSRKNMKHEEFV